MKKALSILRNCRERGQKRAGGLDIDEAIKELEEAMKPKTCNTCKGHRTQLGFCRVIDTYTSNDFYCNRHEPKDNK